MSRLRAFAVFCYERLATGRERRPRTHRDRSVGPPRRVRVVGVACICRGRVGPVAAPRPLEGTSGIESSAKHPACHLIDQHGQAQYEGGKAQPCRRCYRPCRLGNRARGPPDRRHCYKIKLVCRAKCWSRPSMATHFHKDDERKVSIPHGGRFRALLQPRLHAATAQASLTLRGDRYCTPRSRHRRADAGLGGHRITTRARSASRCSSTVKPSRAVSFAIFRPREYLFA